MTTKQLRHIYDLEGLMEALGTNSFEELKEKGYDVRGYFEQRKSELTLELALITNCLKLIDSHEIDSSIDEKKQERKSTLLDSVRARMKVEKNSRAISSFRESGSEQRSGDGPYMFGCYVGT